MDILLPSPDIDRELSLVDAISLRRTKRSFSNGNMSLQDISNILWCGCGETMKATKRSKNRRTVPSACNSQLISVYACLKSGVYKYCEPEHKLECIIGEDLRSDLGTQKMMKIAPFGLIYVGDFSKGTGIIKSNNEKKLFLAGTETGFISQNVYLYCASSKINTALVALVDRDRLSQKLGFNKNQIITYTQIIGRS